MFLIVWVSVFLGEGCTPVCVEMICLLNRDILYTLRMYLECRGLRMFTLPMSKERTLQVTLQTTPDTSIVI